MKLQTNTFFKIISINFFLLYFLLINNYVQASHSAGSDLSYTNISGNTYKFTFKFYRDCVGIAAPTNPVISITSSCAGSTILTLSPIAGTGQEITTGCVTVPTTCSGGTAPGIQEWVYEGTTTLSQCADWVFTFEDCCRNAAITTLQNAGSESMNINATLNNSISQNNSTYFSNIPITFVCIGQNFSFNHGAIDAEGDSLVYSLVTPFGAGGVPVSYLPPYSSTNPILSTPALSLNSVNGDIFMHPTQQQISVIAVRVSEYRNGILIGSVVRDIQIYTVNCNNQLPTATGIDGTNIFTKSLCINGQFCFSVFSNDADLGQTVTMTWNNGIPNATFSTTTAARPIGTFCWTPTIADVRPQPYTFTIRVQDDACPGNGVQSYSFAITVSLLSIGVTGRLETICHGGHDAIATANAASGIGPFTYLWLPHEQTSKTITRLVPGTYSVQVTDSLGCSGVQSVVITEPAAVVVTSTHTDLNCNGALGTATALATGGYGPYTYIWNGDSTLISAHITNLNSGFYKVYARDSRNCAGFDSTIVLGASPINATGVGNNTSCATSNDGSATVAANGGSGVYTYTWLPNVSNTNTANNLSAGTYTCTVSDGSCDAVVTINIVSGNVALIVNLGPDVTACVGDIITLDAGSGFSNYLWNDNSSLQTLAVANDGIYSVSVADANGCTGSDSVNISYISCSRVATELTGVLTVYPNPSNGNFTLSLTGQKGTVSVILTNNLSQVIYKNIFKSSGNLYHDINSRLSKGVYILKVIANNETKVVKIIVQ